MAPRRRVRKFLLGLALFAFFILLLAASLPLWQPWLLKPLSNRHGLHYSTYERVGYARFALIDVAYTNSTTTVTAKRLEAFVPTVWLFKKFTTGQNPPNFLRMDDWLLTQQSPGSNAPPNKPVSPYNTVQTINETLSTLHRWIPQALLTNGAMQANALTVRIPNARWQNGSLTAEMNLPKYGKSLALQLKSDKAGSSDILIDSPDLELSSTIHVSQIPTALSLQATNLWRGNPVILTGSFRPDAKLPEQATLQAEHFDLPATMLKPVNYQALTGSLFAHWESNHFVLDLSANAQPEKSEPSQLPPLDLTLHAKGDTESATIETARMSAPWLIAELTQRATIHFQGPLLTNQVTFSLVSDLSRQPLAQLQGMIHGQVIFSPTTNHFPEIAFDLTGSNVIAPKVNLRTLAFHGQLLWPVLALKEANVELADGSKASLKGEADLKAKSIREGEAQLNGTFGREWLPTGYSFSNSVLSAHFSGPLKDLSHSGKINLIHFTSPDLKPLDLQLNWNGRATNSLHSEILLSADASSLAFNGTVQASTNQATLIVDILTLQTNGQPVLQLEHPFHAFLHPNDSQGSGSNHTYSVKLDGLNWIGGDKQVSLQGDIHWPEHGNLTNTIHEVDSGLFNGFLLKPLPNLKINDLLLSANWSNGPARFEARLSSEGTTPRGIPVAISGSISGDGGGISISNLLVSTKGAPIFSATGFLPVIIRPDHPTNLVDLLHDKPLDLQAITQTNSAFWEEIASLTGVVLQDPHLNLNVSGTWDLPQGKITLRARQIKLPETKSKLPVMDNLQLEMSLDKSVARIDNLFFAVQGQPVRASGELPLSEEVWKKLIQKRTLPDLLHARAHILVENAQVAAFAPLLPTLLTPQVS
ncbi:hypothetical protein [Pedosphaera parvula]|uniref:Uncharacterized protein n=1 Tax=Pedosphaera parvula (strain Ellin514) TaxID=320771 RepID=B9XJP9_PEDPL|nr:hypothetical protein [Pedosphaera parvula]EEF59925.1 hypothetical protein Cflav_PD2729 [Pedosphaera parvula Ellin514]